MKLTGRIGLLAVAAAAACTLDAASEIGEDAGAILREAGALLADAGRAIADAGEAIIDGSDELESDAQAQILQPEMIEQACDKEYTRTQTAAAGGTTSEQTYWFAEFNTNTSDISGVDVVLCERQVTGIDPFATPACAQGHSCTGSYRPPILDCQVTSYAEMADGLIRVSCGSRSRSTGASSYEGGYRWNRARITIRR